MPINPANQAILSGSKPMIVHNQNINHIDKQTLNLTVNYKAPSNDNQLASKQSKTVKQRANSYKLNMEPDAN
jgi:hypothetical protein